jgi:type II secretory pathway pseudopilin PulG
VNKLYKHIVKKVTGGFKPKTLPRKPVSAFTIVEVVIVVTVISILAGVVVLSLNEAQKISRDAQRATSAKIIAETLENYYSKKGEYPSCTAVTDFNEGVLKGLDKALLVAPRSQDKTQPSISCQDLTVADTDRYAYVGDGSTRCQTGSYCTSWTLKYIDESDNEVKTISSRQVASSTLPGPGNITVSAGSYGTTGTTGLASIVSCSAGSPQYSFSVRTNEGAWVEDATWGTSRIRSIVTVDEGSQTSFRVQARCSYQNETVSEVSESNVASYVRSISVPSAPVLAKSPNVASGTNDTVTFSWPAVTCPTGTTVEYSRAWGRDDSTNYRTFATSTATSYAVASNYQGYSYKAKARAQCTSPYATSGWSADSNEPTYIRSIAAPGVATNFRLTTITPSEESGGANRLFLSDPPSCGLGTTREGRSRYYTWNSTTGNGRPILVKSANSTVAHSQRWQNNSALMTASEIDFTPRVFTDTVSGASITSYIGDYEPMGAAGNYLTQPKSTRLVVQYRCINNDTGRFSEGLHVDSGIRSF